MSACPWQRLAAAAFTVLLLFFTGVAWADPQGERFSLIQDGLDAGNRHLATAALALLAPVDLPAAEAAIGDARSELDAVLGWLQSLPAAATDRQTRALLRPIRGCQRQLGQAQYALGQGAPGTAAAGAAVTRTVEALIAVNREFSRVETLGPLLVLTERGPRRHGTYSAGESVHFVVRSLNGGGEPCEPLQVTVACDAGVATPTVTPLSSTPLAFRLTLGPSRGIAEITVTGCGRTRKAYVVNRGSEASGAVETQLLARVDTPANLTVVGSDWLCWSDDTDDPVKIMPSGGGEVTSLATRLVAPERLVVSGAHLYFIDIRDGRAPDGSVGAAVIRVLKRARFDGSGVTQLGYGSNAAAQLTPDIVVAGDYVYWVTGRASPSVYTVERIPANGGTAVGLYASAGRAITAMAADETHLYWVETAFPDPATIRRLPLAGGDAEAFYSSPTSIGGGLAVRAGQLYVAELSNGRLVALPLGGGPPQFLAHTPAPYRLVTDEINLYWIDESALRAVPLAGGTVTTLAAELCYPSDLCIDQDEVFWTERHASLQGGLGSVKKVGRAGGPITVVAADVRTPVAVAVAEDTVHWCEGGSLAGIEGYGRVAQAHRDGGTVTATLSGISQTMPALTADAEAVYVADGWTLKRLALDGASSKALAVTDFYMASVATDGTRVAWVESDPFGTVRCVPVKGGPVQTLGALNDYAGRITLDGTYAYAVGGLDQIQRFLLTGTTGGTVLASVGLVDDLLATGGTLCYADISGNTIGRLDPAGGATAWLAGISAHDWSCRLASDGVTLYWLTASAMGRVPLAGGPGRTLQGSLPSDPGMLVPNSIAVSSNCVYWTTILGDGTGLIFRTTQHRGSPAGKRAP